MKTENALPLVRNRKLKKIERELVNEGIVRMITRYRHAIISENKMILFTDYSVSVINILSCYIEKDSINSVDDNTLLKVYNLVMQLEGK